MFTEWLAYMYVLHLTLFLGSISEVCPLGVVVVVFFFFLGFLFWQNVSVFIAIMDTFFSSTPG